MVWYNFPPIFWWESDQFSCSVRIKFDICNASEICGKFKIKSGKYEWMNDSTIKKL